MEAALVLFLASTLCFGQGKVAGYWSTVPPGNGEQGVYYSYFYFYLDGRLCGKVGWDSVSHLSVVNLDKSEWDELYQAQQHMESICRTPPLTEEEIIKIREIIKEEKP